MEAKLIELIMELRNTNAEQYKALNDKIDDLGARMDSRFDNVESLLKAPEVNSSSQLAIGLKT